jgi:hypothetical protein
MKFDEGWDDDGREVGAPLPMVPEGNHTGEIVDAKAKRLKFMEKDNNPRGESLVLSVDIRGYQPLECLIPATFRGLVEAVARAAGVPVPVRGEDWDEGQLIGRMVNIDTVQVVSAKGRQYARVEKWHASPSKPLPAAKPAERKPAARTPLQKADAASASNDDIPF